MAGTTVFDVAIVGGGIAGVSAGAHLAEAGLSTVLLEAEPTLAYHTTGRSAAQYLENYGNDTVRRLTMASRPFLEDPGEFGEGRSLLGPRPLLQAGRTDTVAKLQADVERAKDLVPSTVFVDGDEARRILPILRDDIEGALYEPNSMDIDVAGLHQVYVRRMRAGGGVIRRSWPVGSIERAGSAWRVGSAAGEQVERIDAAVVVNAAGAWGDRVAALAGVAPLGLRPLRRTIAVAALPARWDPTEVAAWPLTSFESVSGPMSGYCKPEPGGLMVSPADETPSPPCDAKPDEIDVARGLAVLAEFTTLQITRVRTTWAGLRTFTADRTPVAGFAPDTEGFFWLVGQGGYGIHTAESMGRATCSLIARGAMPGHLADLDLSATRPTLAGNLIAPY